LALRVSGVNFILLPTTNEKYGKINPLLKVEGIADFYTEPLLNVIVSGCFIYRCYYAVSIGLPDIKCHSGR
jgi:hypothetical protein